MNLEFICDLEFLNFGKNAEVEQGMYKRTKTILDEICDNKVKETNKRMKEQNIGRLKEMIQKNNYKKRDFAAALKKKEVSLIAEIKKSSPANKGEPFREDFNVARIAKIYEKNGASALSVITDEKFFRGELNFLSVARRNSKLPILQKDFIIHPFQVYEAKARGADAILLIAAILEKEQVKSLYNLASKLDLDCLVEIHNKNELKQILKMKPQIIGVNNRDLKTMEVDIKNFSRLAESIPDNIIKVAESGIKTHNDVLEMEKAGADAVLVGTSLIKSDDIGKAIDKLLRK